MIDNAIKYPESVHPTEGRPAIWEATLMKYTSLFIPAGVVLFDVEDREYQIGRMSDYLVVYKKNLSNIDYILQYPKEFISPNIST